MRQLSGIVFFLLFSLPVKPLVGGNLYYSNVLRSLPVQQQPSGATLRIFLQLESKMPFLGFADLSVTPNEGHELLGVPKSMGETVFLDVPPGTYIVEASAPGFLPVRLRAEIEKDTQQKAIAIVMKPTASPSEAGPSIGSQGVDATTGTEERNMPVGTSTLSDHAERDYWMAHELEDYVPPVKEGFECPTDDVLKGAGQRMVELVSNLEKFTATERLEHFVVEGKTHRGEPQSKTFAYVVTVSRSPTGTFSLEEYRNGSRAADQFPGHIASFGLPALALIFHPELATDFSFRCEGLGSCNGRAAWQIHFVQKSDRPVRIRAYQVNGKDYDVYLEGRAWIDPDSYQVVRFESELVKPIPEIRLDLEHTVIEYESVRFRNQQIQIWLPRSAELYVDRKRHRYYRKHSFTDFKVFNVDAAQDLHAPKGSYSFTNFSDRDIAAVLKVQSIPAAKRGVITLSFTVPARGKVFKVVGPGGDIDITISEVASATFAHSGPREAIKVDVDLGRETILEVLPENIIEP